MSDGRNCDLDLSTSFSENRCVPVPDFGPGSSRSGIRPFLANPAKSGFGHILAVFGNFQNRSARGLFTAESNETSLGLSHHLSDLMV